MRSAVAPLYLFACLVLGGSAQGVWQNMVLQLVGLLIIGWAALARDERPISGSAKALLVLAMAAIAIVALEAVPLPPSLWAHGVRARTADGYRLLGTGAPALPLSLTPYASLASILALIPPLAMFCAVVRLKSDRSNLLVAALLAGAVAGLVLGLLQVAGGANSRWYLYPETNAGLIVGFFANANHMAALLVIALAFCGGIAATVQRHGSGRRFVLLTGLGVLVFLLFAGVVGTNSAAGLALAIAVLVAGVLTAWRTRRKNQILALIGLGTFAAAIFAVSMSATGGAGVRQQAEVSTESRIQILETTGRAIADFMPMGSGLGSFVRVYPLYENPAAVTGEYVVHAHNDYAELALELGLPGIVLLLLFLWWWIVAVWHVWRRCEGGAFVRAASIGSGAVLLHSFVDFPLRTAAVSACFAMCLGLLAERRASVRREAADLRPTRHLVIG